MFCFHPRAAGILAFRKHWSVWQSIIFIWLFWAAGGKIYFHREGLINLQPPLNALFNRHLNTASPSWLRLTVQAEKYHSCTIIQRKCWLKSHENHMFRNNSQQAARNSLEQSTVSCKRPYFNNLLCSLPWPLNNIRVLSSMLNESIGSPSCDAPKKLCRYYMTLFLYCITVICI
jgi:hypothetical protein